MEYRIRKAQLADLSFILDLYAGARAFMADHGNETQWGQSYPSQELLRQDISREKLYVITDAEGIHGVFYFAIEPDPTYAVIQDGQWHSEDSYGVIHRIAGDGSGGILRTAVNFVAGQIPYIRIDTHRDNYVMQKALTKLGFSRCGTIYVEDGTPRVAFDRLMK